MANQSRGRAMRITKGRTLSDALREVAGAMDAEGLLPGQKLRHDRNAVRIAKRLVVAEARRLEERARARAHWDGQLPPPAAIRCPNMFRETLGPNAERVSGCMLLEGHDGACDI